jgi:hypothetical protein
MAVLNRICNEAHRPIDDVNPDVPIELAELVDRLLAKNPAERFATAQEVETHLASLLSDMQQGRRLRRRGWLRHLRQRRALVTRLAIVSAAAFVCMLFGAWVTRLLIPTQTIVLPDRVPSIPADTFASDVKKIEDRLETAEVQAASDSITSWSGGLDSYEWQVDVSELESELTAIEESFGVRVPSAATETRSDTPTFERKER